MSIFTQGAKALARNAGKIVKGIKRGVPSLIKGVKSSGVNIGKGLKNTGAALSGIGQTASQAASAAATSASKAATVARDTIGKGVTKVKRLFTRPQGVVKEVVIKKGGPTPKPILRTRVREGNFAANRFDETLSTGLKNIQDIPKTGVVNQTLTKSQRLGAAKEQFRSTIGKPQKGMAYI